MVKAQDFGAILAESAPVSAPQMGEIVTGTILSANQKMILIDLNGQFTGIIAGADMHSSTDDVSHLQVGDKVEAMVIADDENSGLIVMSLRKASQVRLIERLHTNFDSKEILTVIPNEANKGGLLVDLDGMKGFIPVSQLTPLHYPRVEGADPEKILEHLNRLVGKPFKVRVINVDQDGKKIIFSEKAAVEEQRSTAFASLKVGDVVEGSVSGILTYGLFITFNGLEGLVHVSEIDWGHVSDPSKFAKIGDALKVMVIGIEADKISLSIKRLRANPWDELAAKFQVGDVIEAPVVRISNFGVFVALHGGINGLIHLSEISNTIVKNIEDFVKVGDTIKAKIITFEPTEKRIGLSMKALEEGASEASIEEKVEKKAKKAKSEDVVNVEAAEEAPKKTTRKKKDEEATDAE